jgi:hypothetical protein
LLFSNELHLVPVSWTDGHFLLQEQQQRHGRARAVSRTPLGRQDPLLRARARRLQGSGERRFQGRLLGSSTQPEKQFTWWGYRLNAFQRGWGLRIDHILLSPQLAAVCKACEIDTGPRKRERPSDHARVIAEL